MEQTQIEEQVGEIETRVDRLRSLYEQYFMGIEKMEPLVPKKDVERRFQVLRKVQIRNTALRFRFQMILQKYNTYQSYWMRIMRQIEDGTYKRDLLRAKNNPALRKSVPPPKPAEVEVDFDMNDATVPMMDLEFDADLPTRQVDVPSLRTKEASSSPFGFDDAATSVVNRPGEGFDEDPTTLYLPVVDAKKKPAPAPPAPPAATPIARVRLAQADPEKLRALAAQIKAKKAIETTEPTAPPRRLVAEAPPMHQPAAAPPPPAPAIEAKKPGPPPLNRPPTAPGAFKPLAPPMGAKPAAPPPVAPPPAAAASAPKPAPPPLAKPAPPPIATAAAPAAKPAGPPPLRPPTFVRPPTPAAAAPPPAKPPPPPLNRPPTAPGAFKPLAPPMNKPPVPSTAGASPPKPPPPQGKPGGSTVVK